MGRVIFDIEANGLYHDADTIWCVSAFDGDYMFTDFNPWHLDNAIRYLRQADVLVGHNIIGYDLPTIWKIHGRWHRCPEIIDTLVVSRALNPERKGGHSLEAWGERLGYPKGEQPSFDKYSDEMLEYCQRDVSLTEQVFRKLEDEYGGPLPSYRIY